MRTLLKAAALCATGFLAGCGKQTPTVVVHEFYTANLDRYFRAANAG